MDSADRPTQAQLYCRAIELFGELAVPPCEPTLRIGHKIREIEVFDPLRRKFVALTPEEWVRMHFVAYMIDTLGYSPLRIANEVHIVLNDTRRRADTVVYDDTLRPQVVVEYKAPGIALTADVLNQVLRYNLVFNARAVMISNGRDVYSYIGNKLVHGVVRPDDL